MRAKDVPAAQREMDALKALKVASPIIADLAAEIRAADGDLPAPQDIYRDALLRFPPDSYTHLDVYKRQP